MGVDTVIYADIPGEAPSYEQLRDISVHAQSVLGDRVLWVDVARKQHAFEVATPQRAELARPGYWRLIVNSLSRYYGPGYTRGPIVEIIAVMRFLRLQWPDAELHYGGDSGDVDDLPLWTDETENEMWALLFSPSGRDYFQHRSHDDPSVDCDFCARPININMWGGQKCGGYCPSCDRHWVIDKRTGKRTETHQDYETPKESGKWPKLPTVTFDLGRVKAAIRSLHEGEHRQGVAIELEQMLDEARK